MLKQTNMKQSEYGFAQTLLITAVIAAIAVIGYLMWDRSQNQYVTPSVQITTQQNQPIRQAPEPEKDNINTIEGGTHVTGFRRALTSMRIRLIWGLLSWELKYLHSKY